MMLYIRGLQYSTVQYSTVQYSTVQYSTVQYMFRPCPPFWGTCARVLHVWIVVVVFLGRRLQCMKTAIYIGLVAAGISPGVSCTIKTERRNQFNTVPLSLQKAWVGHDRRSLPCMPRRIVYYFPGTDSIFRPCFERQWEQEKGTFVDEPKATLFIMGKNQKHAAKTA